MTSFTKVFGTDTVPPSGTGYRLIALTANVALNWTTQYSGPDYVTDINEVTASTSGWVITLPAANQAGVGMDMLFRNIGAYPFQLNNALGVPIAVVGAGETKYVYLVDNSTAAGTWRTITYGTGTSQADAAQLAGNGLAVAGNTLQTSFPMTIQSASVTPVATDRARVFVFNGGAASLTLPSIFGNALPNGWFIGVRNSGTGTISLNPTSPDLLDNGTGMTVQPGESCLVMCSGNTWFTIGYGRSATFSFTKLVKDVSAGGSFTLTANEASNKLISFSGTPATNVTVTCPALVNVYYVNCTYTGAPTLTFKTASGAGVSFTAGSTAIVFCDGTNMYSIAGILVNNNSVGVPVSSFSGTFPNGTAAAPGVTFTNDSTSGVYLSSTGVTGLAAGGTRIATFAPSATVNYSSAFKINGSGPNAATVDVTGSMAISNNGSTALAGGMTAALQVAAASASSTRALFDSYGAQSYATVRSSSGTLSALGALTSGTNLGAYTFAGRRATTWSGDTAQIIAAASENWNDSATGTRLLFSNTANGSTTPRVVAVIDQNGWMTVGGSSNPVQALTVNGNITTVGTGRIVGNVVAGSSTDGSFPVQCENNVVGNSAMIQFRYTATAGNTADSCYLTSTASVPFLFQGIAPSYTPLLQSDTSGNLTAHAYNTTSDERLKKDWAALPDDFLEQLAGVKHGFYTHIETNERNIGASAQSFASWLPESVVEESRGYLTLSYGNTALVAAVALAKRVLQLEERLKELDK